MKPLIGLAGVLTGLAAGAASAQAPTAPAAMPPAAATSATMPEKSVAAEAKTAANANSLTCQDFQRNPDGTWSPSHTITLRRQGLVVTLKPGEIFGSGTTIIGMPLADMLDKQC